MSNIDKVIKWRAKQRSRATTAGKLATSVTITDDEVWINGVRFPWWLHDEGLTIEWDEGEDVNCGVVNLPLLVIDDDAIIIDLRSQTLADEFNDGQRVQWGGTVVDPEPAMDTSSKLDPKDLFYTPRALRKDPEPATLGDIAAVMREFKDAGITKASVEYAMNKAYGEA